MVERYGDFVLYRPPLKTTTVLLWMGPFVLLFIALFMLVLNVRRRRFAVQPSALNDADAAKARALLATPPQD
jgi:cytochrome c-type biogenesis protein CcmH